MGPAVLSLLMAVGLSTVAVSLDECGRRDPAVQTGALPRLPLHTWFAGLMMPPGRLACMFCRHLMMGSV